MNNDLIPEEVYDNLPGLLKDAASAFSGRERDIVLMASITAISATLPNAYGIYDGNKYYTNLYFFVVAPPASGKSVLLYPRGLVEPIHEQVYDDRRRQIEDCRQQAAENSVRSNCPPNQIKIIPGNISSADIYGKLEHAHFGAIIFESEADTLVAALKQEWGNFSDVLRVAFHHEPISISRKKEDSYVMLKDIKLSLVLSGTPNQAKSLIQSIEMACSVGFCSTFLMSLRVGRMYQKPKSIIALYSISLD